ncbi:hypothetical protein D6825_01000 [Candidatus Woesearchaeota archaeon]|nr:MAG: hypothetical protein D6825_01000 [Candidatus Woesearchaeota archaeon]
MKKVVLFAGGIVALLILAVSLKGGATGGVVSAYSVQKTFQIGVVLLASLGILVITLINVVHKEE